MIYWNRDYIDINFITGISKWFYSIKNVSSYETISSTIIRFTDSDDNQINEVFFNMFYFLYDGIYLEITDDKTGIAFSFKYLNNQNIWQNLTIVDETNGLLNSGEITWEFPEDFNYYEDFPLKMEITNPPTENDFIPLKYRMMTNIYNGNNNYLEYIISDATTQSENFLIIDKEFEKTYQIKYGLLIFDNSTVSILGRHDNKENIKFIDGKYKGIFHGITSADNNKELTPITIKHSYYSEASLSYGLSIDLSAQNRLYLYDSSYFSNINFKYSPKILIYNKTGDISKFSRVNSSFDIENIANDVELNYIDINVSPNEASKLKNFYLKLNNCNIYSSTLIPSFFNNSIYFENIDFIINGDYAIDVGYSYANNLYSLRVKDILIKNNLSLYNIKRDSVFTNNNLSSIITISNSIKVKVTNKDGVLLSGVNVNIKDRFGNDSNFVNVPLQQNYSGRLILRDNIPTISVNYNNFILNDIVFIDLFGIGKCIDVDSTYCYFQPINWSSPINFITSFFESNLSITIGKIYKLYKLDNSITTNIEGFVDNIVLPSHYLYRYKTSTSSEIFEVNEENLFPFTITLSKFGYETQTIIYDNPKANDELNIIMSEGGGGISIAPTRITTNRIGGKRNV